jgi:hypothetical protein
MERMNLAQLKMRAADLADDISGIESVFNQFIVESGIGRAGFGKAALGDAGFMSRLARRQSEGKMLHTTTLLRALRFIAAYDVKRN